MAEACVSRIPGVTKLLADKGYDTDAFRAFLKDNDIKAVIPGKSNRKCRRALLLPPQRLQTHRNPLRQARQKLLLGDLLRGYSGLLAVI